jgi:acetyl esterase/lipase
MRVPTRHGDVRCLAYRAPDDTTARPLYVNMHGGGFVVRFPEMDDPMCHDLVEPGMVKSSARRSERLRSALSSRGG